MRLPAGADAFAGALTAVAFTAGAEPRTGPQIICNTTTGALSFDQDGVLDRVAIEFATITAHFVMANTEFTVV